jgi:4'-phosphopantetheinyl transferase
VDPLKLSLWFAYPKQVLAPEQLEACIALINEEERAQMARFRFERNRLEFLATRVLLRTALSDRHQLPRESWRYRQNAWGKPAVEPDCNLRFNVSNCAGLVVCVTAEGAEVGIDAESHERAATIAGLAGEVFSSLEQDQLRSLKPELREDRALSLWVLKEAWIKAHGMGMSLPLKCISFIFDESGCIHLELAEDLKKESQRPWRYALLDHSDHRIALVAETLSPCFLEAWTVCPLLTPPQEALVNQPVWYPVSG